jgi:hypothetical protein
MKIDASNVQTTILALANAVHQRTLRKPKVLVLNVEAWRALHEACRGAIDLSDVKYEFDMLNGSKIWKFHEMRVVLDHEAEEPVVIGVGSD